ncbi:MAG: hypothetical protein K2G77_09445 [Muribaculaceae bacterium]|nr:hypothetical protein [Muribaculaceae bacterium]
MKKYNIFLLSALALGFASCEDTSDLGIAQVNPQLPSIEIEGFALSGVPNSVNLDATVNQTIPVATIASEPGNLPEGSTIKLTMQLANNADFANSTLFDVVNGGVSSDDWEDFILKSGIKSPENVTNYIRFGAYVVDGTQMARLGDENTWFGETAVTVTPVDLKLDVESSYYLVTASGKTELNHSDIHVYDDPIFSTTIEVSSDELPYYWQIAPGSKANGSDADFYGVSETGDATALEGNLVLGSQKGEILEAGKYAISANMLDKTYSIIKMVAPETDYLWTPGPANGWGFDDNMLLSNNNDGSFGGYVYIQEKFKLCAHPNWDENWGLEGGLMTSNGPDIAVDPSGLYYVVANFNNMTVGLTEITSISVIGDFNGWGGDAPLAPNATYNVWSGDVDFTAAGGWKFRMNNDWPLNLGGATMDALEQGGDNLQITEPGVYTVTLDLSKLPYSCTVVKK